MSEKTGFWKWLITEGKFWLLLWLFCFIGMLCFDVVCGCNLINIFATIIWYVFCFFVLYGLYIGYLGENDR